MKIGITLDEVIRDFMGHLTYTLDKYRGKTHDISFSTVTEFDLVRYFEFDSKQEMYQMFYEESSLELFGHPDHMHDNIMSTLNIFNMDMVDEEEGVEVTIISRAVGRAIPATLFFLSKLECEIPEIKFVHEYEDMWDNVDILVTANPIAMNSKPEGKVSIKIDASYNHDTIADFAYPTLMDFINATDVHETIFNRVEV